MKKKILVALGVLVALIGVAPFVLRPPKVSPEAIASSVVRDTDLIERAWALPAAAEFRRELTWQSNGSLCGPSSVANTLRSLGDQATSEAAVLEGTGLCWSGICFMGITLDQLGEVARAHTKRKVTVLRNLTPEQFRDHLRQSNDTQVRYIANFTRKAIFGGGGGHHSPIGGYLEDKDLVFVLDVNRDFGPWLVSRETLFAAIDTQDGDKKRGLVRIE